MRPDPEPIPDRNQPPDAAADFPLRYVMLGLALTAGLMSAPASALAEPLRVPVNACISLLAGLLAFVLLPVSGEADDGWSRWLLKGPGAVAAFTAAMVLLTVGRDWKSIDVEGELTIDGRPPVCATIRVLGGEDRTDPVQIAADDEGRFSFGSLRLVGCRAVFRIEVPGYEPATLDADPGRDGLYRLRLESTLNLVPRGVP